MRAAALASPAFGTAARGTTARRPPPAESEGAWRSPCPPDYLKSDRIVGVLAGGVGEHGLDGAGGRVGDGGLAGSPDRSCAGRSRHVLPRDVCRRAIAAVSRHARRHSLGGRRLYLGWLVPTLYRCRALVWALWPGAQGRPAASGEGADDGGCRMFLRVRLLLRRSRGRVPWVRGSRDPDGRAGVRRHRARPAGAAQPGSEPARAWRAGGDLAGMGGADPGSPSRHRDERQHVPGGDRPGEQTLAGEQSRLAQDTHSGAAQATQKAPRLQNPRLHATPVTGATAACQ